MNFEIGSDFKKWASVIARHRVMRFRTLRHKHLRTKLLSDEVFELIASDAVEQSDVFEERRFALRSCLEQNPRIDRTLVAECYGESQRTFREVAEQLGRPSNTVYKALQRVRRTLRECVERKLSSVREVKGI